MFAFTTHKTRYGLYLKYMKKFTILIVLSIVSFILLGIFVFKKRVIIKNPLIKTAYLPDKKIVNSPISIDYLRSLKVDSKKLLIEKELENGSNYKQYIGGFLSEGNKVFGLLTVPTEQKPIKGFPVIIFNHGYIPPSQYVTTEGYVTYVDYLAKNGFVVFKIDFRGNGKSEGDASGSYFSSAYTIDAISALKSLQKYDVVDPKRIGMWGHSMAGNLVFRAMLVSNEIKAGAIWSGAVYSYKDFVKYQISDNSYVHRPYERKTGVAQKDRETSPEIQKIRSNPEIIDFNSDFWKAISLTENVKYLSRPLQIHHAIDDLIIDIGYSRDLVKVLKANSKKYEFYEYEDGGHNIASPSFETAMERTVRFFKGNL